MSVPFRDDHDAAVHRADALERRLAVVERDRDALVVGRRRGRDWRASVPAIACATLATGFTAVGLTLGWSAWWAGGGFVLMVISLLGVVGAGGNDLPQGAVPVRATIEGLAADAGDGASCAVGLTAIVRVGADGPLLAAAQKALVGHTHDEVAALAATAIETSIRAAWAPADAGLDAARLTRRFEATARERLATVGLGLDPDALWLAAR